MKQRFEREAQAIAALQHPHICVLHDVGHENGMDFLVMEYLEGETLAERIGRSKNQPLKVEDALLIAIQIADALDKAHRHGIVHRDLKPGNIMLTKSGAKLLDFGLAKLGPQANPLQGLSAAPTMSVPLTGQGSILGTFQYMAPEQLEGKDTDALSDIFAFGAVMYEMLTGQKAFEGKSQAHLIAEIMSTEPKPMSINQPLVPPLLDHIVKRCLAKEPDNRWQSSGDVMRELKWIAEASAESKATLPEIARRKGHERVAWMAAVLFAVAFAALLAFVYFRAPVEAPETRVDIVTPATSDPVSFAISPDGRSLVFVASGDGPSRLWLRPLDRSSAQPLAGTEGASYPFWSPDSRSLGFFAEGKLKRIDIGGGLPQTLANASSGRGGAWSPDGTILFAPTSIGTLFRIAASGGEVVQLTNLDRSRVSAYTFPQFLPDGKQFLFYVSGRSEVRGIYIGSLNNPDTRRLTAADRAGLYAPSGWLLYARQQTLVARRFDPARGELTGDPITVADPVSFDPGSDANAFSVSATGLITYRAGNSGQRQLTWFDRSGKIAWHIGYCRRKRS